MFKRIAIMGTGSLGTVLGAFISGKRQIDLIDANRQHVETLNRDGATISGMADLKHVPVHAITPEEMTGEYDLFIYMAKQTYNDACLTQMKKHSYENTYVCCCQNGLPEQAICSGFSPSHIFGASVGWGASWLKPGCAQLTTEQSRRHFSLGSAVNAVTAELMEVKEILEYMCPVELSEDLLSQRWTKLHINAAYSGLSAVMGGTFGDVMDDELATKWAVRVGRECVRICRANHLSMIPDQIKGIGTIDFMKIYDFATPDEENACIETVRAMNEGSRSLVASMLQDLRKGIASEVDAIVGAVVRAGRDAGVPTPYADAVMNVIKKKAAGEIPVDEFPREYFPDGRDENE